MCVCVCVLPSMLSMSTPSVVVGVRAGSADPLLFCHCHMAGPAAPPPGRGYPLLGDLNTKLCRYRYTIVHYHNNKIY